MTLPKVLAPVACALGLSCGEPPPPRPVEPEPSALVAPSASATASASASAEPVLFEPQKVTLSDKAMGTKIVIASFTTPELDQAKVGIAISQAYREVQRLEKLMSTWVPSSEVSLINAAAGKDAIKVGPETFAVIDKSLWIGKESGGVFDISFEAMKGLWKFDEGAEAKVPDAAAIKQARALIDYKQIELDPQANTVKLKKPGMRINLGGIAKGYAVDAAARVMEQAGLRAYFIQAGGDLYVRGKKPDGSRFRVGIRDPRGKHDGDYFAMMEVEDHAFSTAGDYERAFLLDGKRYHHIIDPRTGYPATAARSVTVWAKDALTADAIDDAVFILGPKDGMALVDRMNEAGAVLVDAKNQVTISKRLEGLVSVTRPPTDGL